jgi:hypothetical protein
MKKRGYSDEFPSTREKRVTFTLDKIPPALWIRVKAKAKRDGVSLRAMTDQQTPPASRVQEVIAEAERLLKDWDANTEDYSESAMCGGLAEDGYEQDAAALWAAAPRLVRDLLAHLASQDQRIRELDALIHKLDVLLKAGGINDLAFHVGQVKGLIEHEAILQERIRELEQETETKCKHCGEPIRQDSDGDWMDAETHLSGPDGHRHEPAVSKQQILKAERWWEVYDWCRDIQKLAQQVSARVDEFANAIPDAAAPSVGDPPVRGQEKA